MSMTDQRPRLTRYSRTVGILKVVLPLTALVLLSLVFLTARTIDPRLAITTAEIDVEDRARDPRLSGARFAGVTEDGAALTIVAETARSDPHAALKLDVTGLTLHLEGQSGEDLMAEAARAGRARVRPPAPPSCRWPGPWACARCGADPSSGSARRSR